MVDRSHALARDELVHTLSAYKGYATSDGSPGGDSIIDSNLVLSNDFLTDKNVIIMDGPSQFETALITSFNPVNGRMIVDPPFNHQITAGTIYQVVNFNTAIGDTSSINTTLSEMLDTVYFDAVAGVPGTAWPIGTPVVPVDNLTDLIAIMTARKLKKACFLSDVYLDLDLNLVGPTFVFGDLWLAADLYIDGDLNAGRISNSGFNLRVDGSCEAYSLDNAAGGTVEIYRDCKIATDLTNTDAEIYVYGDLLVANGQLENTNTGAGAVIWVYGNCHVYGGLFNDAGAFYTGYDCEVSNGWLDNYGGGVLSIGKDCFVGLGFGGVYNDTGSTFTIGGNCTAPSLINDDGTVAIYGDALINDYLTNGTGTVSIIGIGRIYGLITNAGTLAYNSPERLTTFTQYAAPGIAANGVTPVTLYDGSVLTKPVKICGFKCTKTGVAWAGHSVIWIEDGAGNKIFPFQASYIEGTDFLDGAQVVFNFEVVVPVASGFNVMFASDDAGDNAGQTLDLDNLDVIEVG
jgi:hypothetical protein